MPQFSDWPWRYRYKSPPLDLIEEFYLPALARATRYDRAVGFFSSRLLARIGAGLDPFAVRDGKMRVISSPKNLTPEDLEALYRGEQENKLLRDLLIESLREDLHPSDMERLQLLTWMVRTGLLEFQLALREHPNSYGLYHEKVGILIADDIAEEEWITFSGSPNETLGGAEVNAESFPVHLSWEEGQRPFAQEERDDFVRTWDRKQPGIKLWTVTEWLADPLSDFFGEREPRDDIRIPKRPRRQGEPPVIPPPPSEPKLPSLPDWLELRDYQRDAVNSWLDRSGRGIYAMATGTGKTITALTAATQLSSFVLNRGAPLFILVIVPLLDLVGQWKEAAQAFGFDPIEWHGKASKAEKARARTAFRLCSSRSSRRVDMVLVTADSLTPTTASEDNHALQRLIANFTGTMLVVGDEMHSLGTERRLKALPPSPAFTLGLSATPKRHRDDEGTEALLDYFGDVIVSIDIAQAIKRYEALVPYRYIPHFIELDPDEQDRYRQLSKQIAAAIDGGNDNAYDVAVRARTRLIAHASGKTAELRSLMTGGLADQGHQIVYVAEGTAKNETRSQLQIVTEMLGNDFNMKIDTYTGATQKDERPELQRRLANGDLDALIAMKCLDEGVDIPEARIGVITASSQNPRQFVQRRGRILRPHPASGKTDATIHDMIVLPPRDMATSESERTLVANELARAAELAEAALNTEARFEIRDVALEFDIDSEEHPWAAVDGPRDLDDWTTT